MANKLTVLVIGATGKQGGHVANALLKRGHKVVAFTRTPSSPHAQNLLHLGAKILAGDLSDIASIEKAAIGVDAIFGVTTFMENGIDNEITQGINIVDVARKTNAHLVFSSIASANKNTGIPHFNSKWEIEKHILQSRIEYTIVCPAYFMENLLTYGFENLKNSVYASPLTPERKLAQVCLDDIANFVVLALENRPKFIRKRIELVSDNLTGNEVVDILSKEFGKQIQYTQTPLEMIKQYNADLATMFEWFEKTGYDIDMTALHRQYPEVHWHTFPQWVKQRNLKARLYPIGAKT